MPASRASLALTADYRARLLARRQYATSAVIATWLAPVVLENDLDEAYRRWLEGAVALVEATKVAGVTDSDLYLARFVAEETGSIPRPRGLDPEPYLDTTDGRPVRQALSSPLIAVKAALAASYSPEQALQLGLVRATRFVATEALDTSRRALGDLMADHERVAGKRRVASANACGACLALTTGEAEAPEARHRTHSHCRCVWEPIVRGVRERYRRPTGREIFDALSAEEQARLFAGRGGAEKAELIRSGAVPFEALVKRDSMNVAPDQFTEASLADLRVLSTRPEREAPATTER